jgi:hypothetical protein
LILSEFFFTLQVNFIISRMLSFHLLVFSDSCVTGNGSWCSHSYTFFCRLLHGEQLCTSSSISQYRGRWVIRIYAWLGFLGHLNVTGLYHNTNTERNRKRVYNVTVMHFQLFSLFVKFNPHRATVFFLFSTVVNIVECCCCYCYCYCCC